MYVDWTRLAVDMKFPVAVLGWGQGAQAPKSCPGPPKFLIGSVVHCFYQKDSEALKYA